MTAHVLASHRELGPSSVSLGEDVPSTYPTNADDLAALNGAIDTFGRAVWLNRMGYADALNTLMRGVLRLPTSLEDLDDVEEWITDLLDAAIERAEREETAEAIRSVEAKAAAELVAVRIEQGIKRPGLLPYFPAPTEPREQVIKRQRKAITGTIAKAAAHTEIRREIAARCAEELACYSDPTPRQKAAATRRHKKAVLAERGLTRIPTPRRVLVTGAQGTRKTTTAVEELAALRKPLVVRITEPSLDKAKEVAADYARAARPDSLPLMVVRGRSAPDPRTGGTKTMCLRSKVANRFARAGGNVRRDLCASCRFADDCGTMDMERKIEAMGDRGVFVMSAAYLFAPCPAPSPDLAIVDEAVTVTAIAPVLEVDPAVLQDVQTYRGGPDLSVHRAAVGTLNALRRALAQSRAPLDALRQAGVTIEDLRQARRVMEDAQAERDAALTNAAKAATDAEIECALNALDAPDFRDALTIVGAVIREWDAIGTTRAHLPMTGITYAPALYPPRNGLDECDDAVPEPLAVPDGRMVLRVRRLRPLHGITQETTILALDGTGCEWMNRTLFGPDLVRVHCPIERNAVVVGTGFPDARQDDTEGERRRDKSYSRQSLTGIDCNGKPLTFKRKDGKEVSRADDAQRLRRDIRTIVDRLARVRPEGVFLCAAKPVADLLRAEDAAPDRDDIGHFGKVRGRNRWDTHSAAVVVGRESIAIEVLEDMARAYLATDPEPFVTFAKAPPEGWERKGWPYVATRGRRMRDGSVVPVEVEVHPDPRVQDVLEQVREAEIVQAADRVRPHNPDRAARLLVLLNALCLDMTYDRIVSHADLVAGGSRFERAFVATGILPLSARDLHRAHPGPFPTEKAAEHALARAAGGVMTPGSQIDKTLIWLPGVITPVAFLYRREGQRGPHASRVLIDLARHPNPKAALEAAIGHPVRWITRDEAPEPPRPGAGKPVPTPQTPAPEPPRPPAPPVEPAAPPPAPEPPPAPPRPRQPFRAPPVPPPSLRASGGFGRLGASAVMAHVSPMQARRAPDDDEPPAWLDQEGDPGWLPPPFDAWTGEGARCVL